MTEEKETKKNEKIKKTIKKTDKTETKKIKTRKPSQKKKAMGITVKSKKKTGSARAVIKTGSGIVRINKRILKIIEPKYIRMLIEEPLKLAGEKAKEVDITVNVKGSGFVSQSVAARGAIAKALVEYFSDEELRKKMLAYDRLLLVDDPRRKESKKPLGKGARAKKQSSKR